MLHVVKLENLKNLSFSFRSIYYKIPKYLKINSAGDKSSVMTIFLNTCHSSEINLKLKKNQFDRE